MSDSFYRFVRIIGRLPFWVSSRPVVMHPERSPTEGPCILAANHHSPFDVPLMIRHTPVKLDFLSTFEVFRNPFVVWFYSSMNAFPMDRFKPDGAAVRTILRRLRNGRVLAMFPEALIRAPGNSVTSGGTIRSGIGKLAQLASVPVVPCVIINSAAYLKLSAWLPVKGVRYGIIYGEPIVIRTDVDDNAAAQTLEREFMRKMVELYMELAAAMGIKAQSSASS
jgi:1-acyl-sn-glycerol-3-phosphate acyltransferase